MPGAGRRFRCACCDLPTLTSRSPSDVCPVCFWEDEVSQTVDPTSDGGPNRLSLLDARANYARVGAADPRALGDVRAPTQAERDA